MAFFPGKTASISIGGTAKPLSACDFSINGEPVDTTNFTSGGATGVQLGLGIVGTGAVFSPSAWSSTTAYAAGASVSYGGVNYTALIANTGQIPGASATYWQVGVLTLVQLLERFCTPFA